jgi:predicted DNA-binding protein
MSKVLPPLAPEPKEKIRPSSVVFPKEMKERIDAVAKARGYSFSAAVVRLCEWALQELEREDRAAKPKK